MLSLLTETPPPPPAESCLSLHSNYGHFTPGSTTMHTASFVLREALILLVAASPVLGRQVPGEVPNLEDTAPRDTKALARILRAREEALLPLRWKAVILPEMPARPRGDRGSGMEGGADPLFDVDLWIAADGKRLEVADSRKSLRSTVVWAGGTLTAKFVHEGPLSRWHEREVFEVGGDPNEHFLKGYLPPSFGLGMNAFPLSEWFEPPNSLHVLNEDELINGVPTTQYLVCRRTDGPTGELLTPLASICLDNDLLARRAQTLVEKSLAPLGDVSEQVVRVGEVSYVSMATWEVLEVDETPNGAMPRLGHYELAVPSAENEYWAVLEADFSGFDVDEVLSLEIYRGARVRDGHTGEFHIHRGEGAIGVFEGEIERVLQLMAAREGTSKPLEGVDVEDKTWAPASCGAVAVYMLLRTRSLAPPLQELLAEIPQKGQGVLSLDEVRACLSARGVPTWPYKVSVDRLSTLPRSVPFLVHLALDGEPIGHFTLAFAASDALRVYDPVQGTADIDYELLAKVSDGEVRLLSSVELDADIGRGFWGGGVKLLLMGLALAAVAALAIKLRAVRPQSQDVALLCACTFLFLSCDSGQAIKAEDGFERIEGSPLSVLGGIRHDLGVREFSEEIEERVAIRNDSDQPVHISSITPSCACSGATLTQEILEPREIAYLDVKLDMKVKFKQQVKVHLASADRWLATFEFMARLDRRNILVIAPESVSLSEREPEKSATVRCLYPEGIEEVTVEEAPSWVRATLHPVGSLDPVIGFRERRWDLHLSLDEECGPGKHRGEVVLSARGAGEPEARVTVSAELQGPVSLSADTVFIGSNAHGVVKRAIDVKFADEEDAIGDIEASAPYITVVEDEGRLEIFVDTQQLEPGSIVDEVVTLNSRAGGAAEVSVIGRVSQ